MSKLAIDIYVLVAEAAVPFAIVFALGNLIINTFLKAAFGGKLTIGI